MRFLLLTIVFLSSVVPAYAKDTTGISRRDGFMMIWQSILRPIEETNEKPFTDVPEGSPNADAITYAKYRGIIDDEDKEFHPTAPLTMTDALLWLFRTRSVSDIKETTVKELPDILTRYPIVNLTGHESQILTQDDLLTLMRSLDAKLRDEVHEISNYSEFFQGAGTAFGEKFNMYAMTAAHRTFPYNTLVKVTNLDTGKSVTVRINDRGPYVKGRDMDLSSGAFGQIADPDAGVIYHATFQRLGDATLANGCGESTPYQQRITKDVHLSPGVPWFVPLGKTVSWTANAPYVVLGQTYPDGNKVKMQNWLLPNETFSFTPSVSGQYSFLLGAKDGRKRELTMTVVDCPTAN